MKNSSDSKGTFCRDVPACAEESHFSPTTILMYRKQQARTSVQHIIKIINTPPAMRLEASVIPVTTTFVFEWKCCVWSDDKLVWHQRFSCLQDISGRFRHLTLPFMNRVMLVSRAKCTLIYGGLFPFPYRLLLDVAAAKCIFAQWESGLGTNTTYWWAKPNF